MSVRSILSLVTGHFAVMPLSPARGRSTVAGLLGIAAGTLLWLLSGAAVGETAGNSEGECRGMPNAIQFSVAELRNTKGLVTAVLYDDNPENFLKKAERLDRVRIDAATAAKMMCLRAPGAGNYAIALYHDENGNRKLDKTFLGVPKEGFGFSRNPGFSWGPPDHADALFALDGDYQPLEIKVTYL